MLITTDSPIHHKSHAGTIWLERDIQYLYGHSPSKQEGPWSVKLVRLGMPKWRLGVSVLFPPLGTVLANGIFSQLRLAKDHEHVGPYGNTSTGSGSFHRKLRMSLLGHWRTQRQRSAPLNRYRPLFKKVEIVQSLCDHGSCPMN